MSNKSLLALAVLALVLLIFFCIKNHAPMIAAQMNAPAATPSASVPALSSPTLRAAARNGKVTLSGELPDASIRDAVITHARDTFGANNVIDNTTIGANLSGPNWMTSLPDVLAQAKGLPGGEIVLEDSSVTVTGQVPDEAVKKVRIDSVTKAVGPAMKVIDRISLTPQAPPANLQTQLNQALLNRIVEFETDSAVLTANGKAILDEVAPLIKQSPQAQIEISGHTDSRGAAAANQKLSQARAESVRSYLATRGVDKAKLKATGYGSSRPIADNTTPEGLQKNRRIEFSVIK